MNRKMLQEKLRRPKPFSVLKLGKWIGRLHLWTLKSMLTKIKKIRMPPPRSRILSQTRKNLDTKTNESILMKYNQSRSPGDKEIRLRTQAFHPLQFFSDDIPKNIVEYDKDNGISYLEPPKAGVLKNSRTYFPRALVIAVDGACPNNGTIWAQKSSVGVYFGPDSPLNSYSTITRPSGEKHTNNYAELMAMLHALELLKHHSKLRQWISQRTQLIEHRFKKVMVIIITDSKFVHNCFTSWLPIWLGNGFTTIEGNPVVNKDLILRIHHMINLLSNDLDIQLWSVRREQNRDADELAVRALNTKPIH